MRNQRARWLIGRAAVAAIAPLLACAQPTDSADAGPAPVQVASPAPTQTKLPQAILADGATLDLELALTREEIAQGLMFRPSLPADRGMLFVFAAERVPSFWMKNTLIPLDLLFLDGDGAIVEIVERAQPCAIEPCPQYIPGHAVRAVLEVSAGTAERHGLDVGDRIEFERVPGYPKQLKIKD